MRFKLIPSILRFIAVSALALLGLLCLMTAFKPGPARHLLLPRAVTPAERSSSVGVDSPTSASPNWIIRTHGECCEGNLAAAGPNVYVLLPVLVNGARIQKSTDNGVTWVDKYPLAPASVPFGIEGDMQAYGTDVTFWGTELAAMVTAHSDDFGESFVPVQNPIASAGNDQAWSYLGPFANLRPGGALPTDEPYVQAGWNRIGSALVFSFDGGLTYPLQTPLVGDDGSGSEHIVCQQNAHAPTSPGDTRVANLDFRNHKAGRYGAWGTDRKFYWAEPSISGVQGNSGEFFICSTDNFGATWAGVRHPVQAGPGQNFVVSHTAFDNNGTLYVLHGNKLYVSFNQGESIAFVHTIPHYGSALLADSGSDQWFVVNCGTIHIAIAEAENGFPGGNTNMWYLRGAHVDTANPTWESELVETVGNNRLDFIQIVVNGNDIPVMSYTKPGGEVTTAARIAPMPSRGDSCGQIIIDKFIRAVSRKTHGSAGAFDIGLPLTGTTGIEDRSGGANGDHDLYVSFDVPVTVASVSSNCGTASSDTATGSDIHVHLTGVPNASRCTVTLNGVSDGANTADIPIPANFLIGDTTANGAVNSSDVAQTQSQSGQPVSATNFREDVTVNGAINSSDVALVQSKSGTAFSQTSASVSSTQPSSPQNKPSTQTKTRAPQNSRLQ